MTLTVSAMQFPHPGPEHRPGQGKDGVMGWNVGDHCRKFMEAPGRWRTEAGEGDGLLRFWGEWEPPSRWERLDKPTDVRLPRFLHRPLPIPAGDRWRQNTDPLVLDGFWYSNCRQHRLTHDPSWTKMTQLDIGSVILFGSKFQHEWVLDTVFVVGERLTYGPGDVSELAREHPLLGEAALRPLFSHEDERRDFVLYRGATAEAPVGGRFSFVPAMPADQGAFCRPKFDHEAMNVNLTQETRQLATGDAVDDVWELARQTVLDAGLVLGTGLHGPGSEEPAVTTPGVGSRSVRGDRGALATAGVDRGRC